MSFENTEQKKLIAYLDQNVLDGFVENGLGVIGEALKYSFMIVYSEETLSEIRRSKGYEKKFLDVLDELNAFLLKETYIEESGLPDGNAIASKVDVYQEFDKYCANNSTHEEITDAQRQFGLKLAGGRQGDSLREVLDEQVKSFEPFLSGFPAGNIKLDQLKDVFDTLVNTIGAGIEDTSTMNPPKEFREAFDIGPKELNNISPPKVIEKIWDMFKTKIPENPYLNSLEEFFQIKVNPLYPNQPIYRHQKVSMMYRHLNLLGYFPDSKVHKERRFVAASSDSRHASMASFCQVLISNDISFTKKTKAIYEYLHIPTMCFSSADIDQIICDAQKNKSP